MELPQPGSGVQTYLLAELRFVHQNQDLVVHFPKQTTVEAYILASYYFGCFFPGHIPENIP